MEKDLFGFGYYDTDLNEYYENDFQIHYTVARDRILKYSSKAYHKGLNESKIVTAPEEDILIQKLEALKEKWNDKWEKLQNKNEAERRTEDALALLDEINYILSHPFEIKDKDNWMELKKLKQFDIPCPPKPKTKLINELPQKPDPNRVIYKPNFDLLESLFYSIFKSLRVKKLEKYRLYYEKAVEDWEVMKNAVENENLKIEQDNKNRLNSWEKDLKKWQAEKIKFENSQQSYNEYIDRIRKSYNNLDLTIFEEYIKLILTNSEYPDFFGKDFDLMYSNENQILVVDYSLPDIDAFPRIKEVKYISTRNEQQEIFLSEVQFTKLYEDTLYRIALRTLKEIFEADYLKFVKVIVFNGWVNSINKSTGNRDVKCILSIQVKRKKFLELNLNEVEPKACFKSLKGIASSKLSTLTPIQPIVNLNKNDSRFVEGYSVSAEVDSSTNIAAMDWKDFEHFIREIFEREFSSNGGEVKVTQASRDGGVDAIAYDPDPIKGGKIIIQAKRYTNLVDVSAVRDLYGTVVNEGAIKGILVTTSNYGADSYEFAKDKPITLLNGGNLLHLLEKQGQKVRIDLKEAKKILKENKL